MSTSQQLRQLRRRRQHGGVTLLLIVVLILLAALVGALAVRGSFSDLRLSGGQRVSRTSFYCAEAGLNALRPIIGANFSQWNAMLNGSVQGGQANPYTGSIVNGVGNGNDYKVWIVDNKDELPPIPDNQQQNSDLTVIMISVCTSAAYNGTTSDMGGRELHELVIYVGNGGTDYRAQAGHSSTHSGNANPSNAN
jgi:Tfp pilus assembly protein PilX